MSPASIINPSIDIAPSSCLAIISPKKPPVKARGMENKIINGDASDWNWATIMR